MNAIVATGLYVTMLSGQLSSVHGALMGVGAYTAAVLTKNFGWPFEVALLAGAALTGILGAGIAAPTARMRVFTQSLTTLAFGQALSIAAYNFPYIGGAASFIGIRSYTTIPIALSVLAIVVYFAWRFDQSRLGLAARAVRDNELAASTSGVDIVGIRTLTFALGGAIAGIGGGLSAHYVLVVDPADLSFLISFIFLVFVLAGGSYNPFGPLLGAGILTIVPQLLRFTTTYRFALYGLMVVLIVLLRPEGMLTRRVPGRRFSYTTAASRLLRRLRHSLP